MSIEQPPRDLEISTFANVWDVAPKRVRCSVGGLVRALTTFPVLQVPDKRSLPAWSPATFTPGSPRRADTVLAVGCLVLDVDEGDPEAAFEPWPGLLAVTHTTWSHCSERPHYRLVLPLFDLRGELVNVQARSLDPTKKPKVVFPKASVARGCLFANEGAGIIIHLHTHSPSHSPRWVSLSDIARCHLAPYTAVISSSSVNATWQEM